MATIKISKSTQNRINKMKAMGIHITIIEDSLTVIVHQKELINGFILNQSQLVSRAAKVLTELQGNKIKWKPVVYTPDLRKVDPDWVFEKMAEHKLSRKDIIKQVGVDKHSLSKTLNKKSFTRIQRAAFYYYFMQYDLNKHLRSPKN